MSPSNVSDQVAELVDERAMLIDWVLERLDDLKQDLSNILEGIDPPPQPPRGVDLPFGAESALEAIYEAICAAERKLIR